VSISSADVSATLHDSLTRSINDVRNWGATGPALLGVAVLNVQGLTFYRPGISSMKVAKADRRAIVLPASWVENLQDGSDVEGHVRPLLDIVWQAFDFERCLDYDATGKWKEPH
jgi:hypothetical protein